MSASEFAGAQYAAVTTFRKDGTPVVTPVWVADLGDDELALITLADTWKVKRIRQDPRVRLQACDVRGRVPSGAPTYQALGRIVDTPEELGRVRDAMSRKYWMARLGNTMEDVLGPLSRRKPRVGIVLSQVARIHDEG